MSKNAPTRLAFGKIKDTVRYRLKFAHFPYLARSLENERARRSEGMAILDVGCGPGNIAGFCDLPGDVKWFGLDLWEYQLVQAAEKRVYAGLFQVNLVDGLPFKDSSFDAVLCNEVLMYLPNAAELLGQFHQVLKANGVLFVYNPITWLPKVLAGARRRLRSLHQERRSVSWDRQTDWKNATRACRITYYSLRSLVEEVRSARFEIIDVTGFRIFRNRIRAMTRLEDYRWYYAITKSLVSRFPQLAADIMVVGRKAGPDPTKRDVLGGRSAV
ncbi:MAG: methyltransferase domain-containing protein [Desulfomonile sp.]|nr:methyltransferase domain-containing protein [Desulfomonile sp.]